MQIKSVSYETKVLSSISGKFFISIPPENVRKPEHWPEMG